MKIAVKLRAPDPVWDAVLPQLCAAADTIVLYDNALEECYPDVEVMLTTRMDAETLSRFPALRRMYLFKTGMDGLPHDELERRNISVTCSHANADVIAEHALALALALLHRIPEFDTGLRQGFWYADGTNYNWTSIYSLPIGILGFGSIGKCLYEKLLPLNRNIRVFNRSGNYPEGVRFTASFEELIQESGLLFLCVPKTPETTDLFNAAVFDRMQGKYLVNVARAGICNEKALFRALSENKLAGYASDVWYRSADKKHKRLSVMPSDYPFETLQNVILSPHCATHEPGAHERYIRDAVNACLKDLQNDCI